MCCRVISSMTISSAGAAANCCITNGSGQSSRLGFGWSSRMTRSKASSSSLSVIFFCSPSDTRTSPVGLQSRRCEGHMAHGCATARTGRYSEAAHSRHLPKSNSPFVICRKNAETLPGSSIFFPKDAVKLSRRNDRRLLVPQLLFSEKLSPKNLGFSVESVPPTQRQVDVT